MQHKHIAKRLWAEGAELSLDMEALSRYSDIIDLSIGDTDFITDERIISAAFEDARAGHTKYGDPQGDPELIDAIRRAYLEDYSMPISRDEVFVTTSSCMGMELAMMAILNPGDEVLIFSPYFTVYKSQIELAGGIALEVPTYEEDGYAIREELLRAAITNKTRAIIFNNPTNPTGAAYGMGTMRLLASVAEEHDLIIAADEIYTRYMFDGSFIPFRSLPGMADRTITLNSFSKNFMMTGWRIGYIVAAKHFIKTLMRINNSMVYTAPAPSQRAAIKALSIRESIAERYISEYKARVMFAADRIERISYMSVMRPKGTFYIFPGIKKTGLSSAAFCERLLDEAHVLASPGSVFGSSGEGHFRIACTVGIPKLAEAFDRMEKLSF